tara:strand:- start:113 stop:985 length:873 start_codon:yes stop_codon:yes gene_type:complete
MKRYIFYLALNLSIILTISCDTKKSDLNATHIGGCILRVPSVKPPSNLYSISKIIQTDEYQPFTKKLTVCGITLIGREDISDDFMKNVALTIKEMFSPDGENIDKELQERLITNMYEYRTVIPLFKGENYEFSASNEEKWDRTVLENSICDIIMEGVSGQVTEVVEHILHFVTAIGMHYTFPNEWGISRNSELYKAMNQAIDNGFYDITQYNEIDEAEDRLRVLLQEYAYWTIYTAWNLREPYGPKNAEWSIMTKSELINKLPDSNMLFEKYVTKVFTAPSKTILESFVN